MNHHDILGVSPQASIGEIKSAYRKAAKEYHPDLSDSPEAAEAFARIKGAHDALIEAADAPRESVSSSHSAARAAAATASAAYGTATDTTDRSEEIQRIQTLDEQALRKPKRSLFHKTAESEAVKKHRKKLKTNERRLRGLY